MGTTASMRTGLNETGARETPEIILSFENVSRSFGGVNAVEGINLHLRRGEVLTLLGPSGCGKTTTLRMAIGLERAATGRITYRGKTVDDPVSRIHVPPERREMGMVFQSYAIWPHLNVFENVAYPLKARGLDKRLISEQVRLSLETVGLGGFERRSGMQLSGGQQQRVAVARGLVAHPDLLLMDEPFSNLDAKLRDQVRLELRVLQKRLGLTILFVTHDQTEALALSDRIAVMQSGKVIEVGSPLDLYLRPRDAFVRDFLGQTIKLPGRIVGPRATGTEVSVGEGSVLLANAENHLLRESKGGTPCVLTIRPEEVRAAVPNENCRANILTGSIRTLLFLGTHYGAVIGLHDGPELLINLPRHWPWREGDDIGVEFPADLLQLWSA